MISKHALTIGSLALALSAGTAFAASPGVQAGKLVCDGVSGSNFIVGSTANLSCTYKPVGSQPAVPMMAKINHYGIDFGKRDDVHLVWYVLAPSTKVQPESLAGYYGGVSAGASLGRGVQANTLIGGSMKSIALNPVSLQSESGANLTAAVTGLHLRMPMNDG
ncbi:hypothetical protein HDIA_2480 [Hartmannibacter diazotrophicus]|uniref:DUF992 domain-containing protein n=1 Tax=Hartmannibacter diazotrophicus TaxID=1482074 RepID=A0A2C9D8E7_9HYPH|nr:DUF992 domain-containing protein [Hartmannibacter diazotrophicus]SON56021.1 hypothetical protein HDIA_2480 [Hartmannibacter diazotrophicus]